MKRKPMYVKMPENANTWLFRPHGIHKVLDFEPKDFNHVIIRYKIKTIHGGHLWVSGYEINDSKVRIIYNTEVYALIAVLTVFLFLLAFLIYLIS